MSGLRKFGMAWMLRGHQEPGDHHARNRDGEHIELEPTHGHVGAHRFPEYFTHDGADGQGDWTELPAKAMFLRPIPGVGVGIYRRTDTAPGTFTASYVVVATRTSKGLAWREDPGPTDRHELLAKGPW